MLKRFGLALVAALLVLTTGAALEGPAEIVDGDTLRLAGKTIRLQGIDAPETRQTCKDETGAPWRCGREATRALARLAAKGALSCRETGRDAYGRTLALCSAGGVDLNRRMVADGWARAFVKYDRRYEGDEAAARAARRGIWRGEAEAPWDWRAGSTALASREQPQGCSIKGNLSRSGERIYHMPWQNDYARTRVSEDKGERWFCSEEDARKAGYRRALR